ncbi:MAM and LDL-receptor class A domain-containing protein 1,MAM and LDL-receptor class A domain-containing protein 2 [Mytilus coruscus]|uniref:MAM and LDL-receptor class A domain-containing protein 1,MAM and LDL-receptor class A domain-containing protein 2 n=1 Tax=Mytilus coruscus TaxID=42192 RepID=A0A6J7ZUJ9_MYTCO|nr:MAM and LDL-receptor class A domain-containing protein 1,MAM and LDL-receptor class A domain-containing protein 2 [Mytilus coruscus]
MDANRDSTSLNCTEEAFIKVLNVRVDDEGYCESEPCIIDERDHEALRKLCDNSNHCFMYRSNISSSCALDQQRRFNMSYMCVAPESLDCSFDKKSLCNWYQGSEDDFNWTHNSGKTLSWNTGPLSDHTTNSDYGFYMYIEANGKSKNDKAQLISKPIVRKQSQCLRFWYHMYGDQIGSLNVYQKLKKWMDNIWTITGNQDKQWNQANVDLHPYEYYQIVIEGKLNDFNFRPRGDIAIDDIYVEEGHCTERSKIICTFEQLNTCGLSNALYDYEYYFSWNIVQGDTTNIGPSDDHTTASGNSSLKQNIFSLYLCFDTQQHLEISTVIFLDNVELPIVLNFEMSYIHSLQVVRIIAFYFKDLRKAFDSYTRITAKCKALFLSVF